MLSVMYDASMYPSKTKTHTLQRLIARKLSHAESRNIESANHIESQWLNERKSGGNPQRNISYVTILCTSGKFATISVRYVKHPCSSVRSVSLDSQPVREETKGETETAVQLKRNRLNLFLQDVSVERNDGLFVGGCRLSENSSSRRRYPLANQIRNFSARACFSSLRFVPRSLSNIPALRCITWKTRKSTTSASSVCRCATVFDGEIINVETFHAIERSRVYDRGAPL